MFKTKFICVGEIDLEILSELHSRHPGAWLDNEVVEPSAQQLHDYKGKDTGLICVVCFPKALLFFPHFPSGSTIYQSFIRLDCPTGVQGSAIVLRCFWSSMSWNLEEIENT